MAGPEKILVIRFSAMGDVAMTVPVLKEFAANYPAVKLVVVSRSAFRPFFNGISNLNFHDFRPADAHKGFFGLIKLFLELKSDKITKVADLHNNLRSKILGILFFLTGIKTVSVDKGRKEKKELTRKHNKIVSPLKLTVSRYADVFSKLGFPFVLENHLQSRMDFSVANPTASLRNEKWIGVSPFAQHHQKVYPLHKMEGVLLSLASLGYRLFIFGGTIEEQIIAESWSAKHIHIVSMVKKGNMQEELEFISGLDLMLSMDSSGMHLASLKNVPVVSVWGATHPYAGFLGYGQSINDAVQIDLYCRPCSVYGNVPCYRGDSACMNNLAEQDVITKVIAKLNEDEAAITN